MASSRKPWPERPAGARRQWAADRALRPAMRSPGRPEPSRAVQRAFWRLIAQGLTSEDAGAEVGVSTPVASRWFRHAGGMAPISLDEPTGRYLSAVKARTAAMNQIHAQLVTAPIEIREKYRNLKEQHLVDALAACRPGARSGTVTHVLLSLKLLAQRHRFLTEQADLLEDQLRDLVAVINLNLLSARGIGPVTAAQLLITAGGNPERLVSESSFAALCGTAPVPASSGKTTRYRLSRGGDRHANAALHTIATVRMSSHARTREFVTAQRARGRSNPEILRILKRAIAREVFKLLQAPTALADIEDLRRVRREKNLSLRAVAEALGTCQAHVSRIERGVAFDRDFTQRYRTWLQAA